MDIRHHGPGEPMMPTPHEVALAEASSRMLAQHLPTGSGDIQLRLVEHGQETEARLEGGHAAARMGPRRPKSRATAPRAPKRISALTGLAGPA